ncbi:MAG: peptidylprolyl isomerase, partial [Nitrospiraceae bacterium]|nr:peptidylprolyl isomerase [Nitrospiraceae bacterium]
TVKEGNTVRIHYVGKLKDGTVFDSSEGGASLEMKLGQKEFIAGIEKAVIGMSIGEKKTVAIPAEEGYGPHSKEKVFEYDRGRLPEGFTPVVGQQMQMFRADGQPVQVTIKDFSDSAVTMDCNHPLAGKDLVFEITIEEIVSQ